MTAFCRLNICSRRRSNGVPHIRRSNPIEVKLSSSAINLINFFGPENWLVLHFIYSNNGAAVWYTTTLILHRNDTTVLRIKQVPYSHFIWDTLSLWVLLFLLPQEIHGVRYARGACLNMRSCCSILLEFELQGRQKFTLVDMMPHCWHCTRVPGTPGALDVAGGIRNYQQKGLQNEHAANHPIRRGRRGSSG
jgi:hypothetical protein